MYLPFEQNLTFRLLLFDFRAWSTLYVCQIYVLDNWVIIKNLQFLQYFFKNIKPNQDFGHNTNSDTTEIHSFSKIWFQILLVQK